MSETVKPAFAQALYEGKTDEKTALVAIKGRKGCFFEKENY